MTLHEFLALPHRFRWGGEGGDDCMTFAASWVAAKTGVDPAAELRGTYRTKIDAHAIIASAGGELAFMDTCLTAAGAFRVADPQTGDIGLVRTLTGETPDNVASAMIGAIRFGPLWAAIHPGGVRVTRAETIAAWRLPV